MRCAPSIPPTLSTKEPPQHAANRLAAVGQGRTDSSSGGGAAGNARRRPGCVHFHVADVAEADQLDGDSRPARPSGAGLMGGPDTLPHTLGAVDLQRGILVGRVMLLAIGGHAPGGPQGRNRVKWYLMVTET